MFQFWSVVGANFEHFFILRYDIGTDKGWIPIFDRSFFQIWVDLVCLIPNPGRSSCIDVPILVRSSVLAALWFRNWSHLLLMFRIRSEVMLIWFQIWPEVLFYRCPILWIRAWNVPGMARNARFYGLFRFGIHIRSDLIPILHRSCSDFGRCSSKFWSDLEWYRSKYR